MNKINKIIMFSAFALMGLAGYFYYPSTAEKVTSEPRRGIASVVESARTYEFTDKRGQSRSVQLKAEAIEWANANIPQVSGLPEDKKMPVYYLISKIYHRLSNVDHYESEYNQIRSDATLARDYFPSYVSSGFLIHFLGPSEHLTDVPQYQVVRGKTVEQVFGYPGDHRVMDNIGADGTHRTAIVEARTLTPYPLGAFNVFYHEFAHTIHFTLMSKAEFTRLHEMFQRAVQNQTVLDDYAATHVSEYFAQAFEAFISEDKSTDEEDSWKYHRHTKQELLQKDPELYHFIESILAN